MNETNSEHPTYEQLIARNSELESRVKDLEKRRNAIDDEAYMYSEQVADLEDEVNTLRGLVATAESTMGDISANEHEFLLEAREYFDKVGISWEARREMSKWSSKKRDHVLMEFEQYENAALDLAKGPARASPLVTRLNYAILKLNGEAGEVAEAFGKLVLRNGFNDDGTSKVVFTAVTPEVAEKILDEGGDVLWYLALIAQCCGSSLQDMARKNLIKLYDRHRNGQLPECADPQICRWRRDTLLDTIRGLGMAASASVTEDSSSGHNDLAKHVMEVASQYFQWKE